MRLKLYWLQKLRAFRGKGLPKKSKLIAAASENSVSKVSATSNTSQHASQENLIGIRPNSSGAASTMKAKHKHYSRLSQVVTSLGCGSTAPLRIRRDRNKPKLYSEEEDKSQAPPLNTFGRMNPKGHHRQHKEEDDVFKDCCIDPYTLTTKRWVGACRCMHDVSVDKGSTRSDVTLLSKKLQTELSRHEQAETKTMVSVENEAEKNAVNGNFLDQYFDPIANKRETHVAKKLPSFMRVEGSMSDRIVVDHRKKINAEVKVLERWSSASVRDCSILKGNSTPVDHKFEKSVDSVSSFLKERSNATSYDESFRIESFERRHRRPPSMTSVSTLSSYDFDRTSYGGSYDATNMPFSSTNAGLVGWQHTNMLEEGSRDQNMRRRFPTRISSTILDPNVSVISYTLSDRNSNNEEECSLLHTVSHARAWLNRNNDEDNDEEYVDDDDDDDTDCLIDLEANAKAWATAWVLSSSDAMISSIKSYGCSPVKKHDNMGGSYRNQREQHAAALKRKYHREFVEKPQAIVVSSHYEDDMNTFMFPHLSDYEDDTSPLKFFDQTRSNIVHQEGTRMADSKRYVRGDEGHDYHSLVVAKKSRNPYADFRDSMVEMVLQKQMHKSSELEELLQSFLSLNSLEHHELIVQAFSEVWEKVFGNINGFHKRL